MSAGTLNIAIEQGVTWDYTLTYSAYDADNQPTYAGEPIDLTGYTARAQIRTKTSSEDFQLELTTENGGITLGGDLGTIDIHITAAQSATLTRSGVWDLEVAITVAEEEIVYRVVQGSVTLSKEVTKEDA